MPSPYKKENKIYLLSRPALDYEDSEQVFAAFETRESAEAARQEIIEAWKELEQSLPVLSDEYSSDEAYDRYELSREIIKRSVFPYNCTEIYDLDIEQYRPESAVAIREIPLYI